MSELVGRPNGRFGGYLAAIPEGSEVVILNSRTDDGLWLHRIAGTYQGPVFDTSFLRIRLEALDLRFAGQNIAADPTKATELQVEIQNIERQMPKAWRTAP